MSYGFVYSYFNFCSPDQSVTVLLKVWSVGGNRQQLVFSLHRLAESVREQADEDVERARREHYAGACAQTGTRTRGHSLD